MAQHRMPPPPRAGARSRGATGRGRVRAALSLGIVLGLGATGTMAAWTDTATATSGMFSTATIDLRLNGDQGNPTAYQFTALNATDMRPGAADKKSKEAQLPVQNRGTAPFTYTMSALATGDAAVARQMQVTVLNSSCATVIAGPVTLSPLAATPVVTGTPAGRALAAGASETLCIRVTLGDAVTRAMQSKSINVSFQFAATTA